MYSFDRSSASDHASGVPGLKLLKTHNVGKKPLDQIGVLAESDQLAILSGQCYVKPVAQWVPVERWY